MSKLKIIVASDSLGETGEFVARAGLSQFNLEINERNLERYPHMSNKADIDTLVSELKDDKVIVVFTFIEPQLSQYMTEALTKANIPFVDVMTPMMTAIKNNTSHSPFYEPGRVHKLDENYFKKIDAIEFAVRYDDGKDPSGLEKSDIVLIGVSRTSKTPLSQFLAYRGYKVVNIALVPEVSLPEELFEINKDKCIGLKIDADTLFKIRKERLSQLGLLDTAKYGQNERIQEELQYFEDVVEKIGCTTINVSDKAIEETANEILQIMNI